MIRLETIDIRNFRRISCIENLALTPINIVIGANGAGKSSLLDAFVRAVAGRNKRKFHQVRLTTSDGEIAATENRKQKQPEWADPTTVWEPLRLATAASTERNGRQCEMSHDEYLEPGGENLAAYLRRMEQEKPETLQLINNTIGLVDPRFNGMALLPDAERGMLDLGWRATDEREAQQAETLSAGTQRFLLLATALMRPTGWMPPVVLLDEPEVGLNPYALVLLAAMMKTAALDTTVVAATQSSRLLDHFDADQVIVMSWSKEDGSTARRLTTAALAPGLEDYSLGTLWEKNEFGGRPGA